MVDLTREMADLYQAVNLSLGQPRADYGRALMFVGALGGEGVSTVAREYARCEAAMAQRPVWLVDADLKSQSQLDYAVADRARFGPPGPLSQASPDGSVFFNLSPRTHTADGRDVPDATYLVARSFLNQRLWVTRLRIEDLRQQQRASLTEDGRYINALRRHVQSVIIDAPALERAKESLLLCQHVDAVIMVVSEDRGTMAQRREVRDAVEAMGGRMLGVVYNRAREIDARLRPQGVREAV